MSTVQNPRDVTIMDRLALGLRWVLSQTRPYFHYAVLLLFQTLLYGAVIQLLVFVFNVFESGHVVDYGLIAHLVGPLGVGALVAGQVRWRIVDGKTWRPWLVAAAYGGTSMAIFVLLVGSGLWALAGIAFGAALFMMLHWLQEIAARQERASQ